MDKKLKDKLTHKVPEVSEWSKEQLEFLYRKMLDLKSQWTESIEESDNLLFLGCALSWDKMVQEGRSLPKLDHSPSHYRDIGRKHRHAVTKCANSIAPKAQAWGGFWEPEDETSQDAKGWKERKSSIAPHIWINIKKKEFLTTINSPLDYENASLKGLEKAGVHFLQKLETTPTLASLQTGHKNLFSHISEERGMITDKQLFHAGYAGSHPREIPWEIENISQLFSKGLNKAKQTNIYKEAEIIRWVAFTMARLLRIHPFTSGNKRLLACWGLTTLTRELEKPDTKSTRYKTYMQKTLCCL
jgi:fido (protein-threonine AMPylation protein)